VGQNKPPKWAKPSCQTQVSRWICFAETPTRVDAINRMTKNQVRKDVVDLWKIVPAKG
jgi:hypothetical protein